MKTAMQELIEWTGQYEGKMISADQVILKAYELLEKEKKQIIAPVNRLCDFYGHPHVGEQMYQTWYVTPKLKPIENI